MTKMAAYTATFGIDEIGPALEAAGDGKVKEGKIWI